jgi:hypothetical protein
MWCLQLPCSPSDAAWASLQNMIARVELWADQPSWLTQIQATAMAMTAQAIGRTILCQFARFGTQMTSPMVTAPHIGAYWRDKHQSQALRVREQCPSNCRVRGRSAGKAAPLMHAPRVRIVS